MAELRLALAHPLDAASAPLFAADLVAEAAPQGILLDYSGESVGYLDSVVASLRASRVTVEQVGEVLLGFGCYFGECILRSAGGEWVASTGEFPIAIRTADGTALDPVAYAFTALVDGASFVDLYERLS